MPPGYHLELVASEPLVQDPVVIDWDRGGRLWVDRDDRLHERHARRPTSTSRSAASSCSRTPTATAGWTRRTVFADGLVLPRALKVLDSGVLVGEPPHLWFMQRHERRSEGRHQGSRQRQRMARLDATSSTTPTRCCGRSTTGSTPPRSTCSSAEGRQVRRQEDAVARPVGRVAGRRRARVPELERIGAARRPRADPVLRAQSRA